MSINVKKIEKTTDYVYDISLDGSVIIANGYVTCSNTDGFNFQMPKEKDFRYTDEHPYISNGKGRNSIKDKAYTGVDADVAEFEDLFLCPPYTSQNNKMGLGVDEYCDATINFARKNYADLLENGKIKLVGNTIKSKKMPIYIEKFLDKGIRLLLNGQGKEFLELYYDYIEEIYNLRIPLQDIATVGKIKTSIKEYKAKCNERTKAGSKRSRQAWYELAIADNLDVNMGDTIYYINTSDKKGASDVQRVTKFYYMENGNKIDYIKDENGEPIRDKKGNIIDLTKKLTNEYNKLKKEAKERNETVKITMLELGRKMYPNLQEEDEVIFNCVRLSNDIVEDEDPHYCDDKFEYNKDKYIDMFNKRIRPLLVCFDKSIRTTYTVDKKGNTKEVDNILIKNPSERKAFTEEESRLVSGQPYNTFDQDTYEQLMTIEDKEIKFWLSINETPPYVKECGIDWNEVVQSYKDRLKRYEEESIKQEIEEYNKILENFNKKELDNLVENGILPDKLSKFVELDITSNDLVSKKHNIKIGSLIDLLEIEFNDDDFEE